MVIPTLAADSALAACVSSLERQTYQNFEVIVVDNSGNNRVRTMHFSFPRLRVIENTSNAGFGTAINQGWRASDTRYVVTLNDDAVAEPGWLAAMVDAADRDPEIGLVACQVRLSENELDSAGMLITRDGSTKQRGHGDPPAAWEKSEDVLMPSGSAALYRREMLDDTGGFADDFFLYCEDSDLGLRARRRGWRCRYVPEAVVYHAFSRTAGRASELKAFLVERNRLYLIVRNFPFRMLLRAFLAAPLRYLWHAAYLLQRRGKAAEFVQAGQKHTVLPAIVLRAHWHAAMRFRTLLAERRQIRQRAYLTDNQFERLLAAHSISLRELASL